jgi:hypothetical protein
MKKIFFLITVLLLLVACERAEPATEFSVNPTANSLATITPMPTVPTVPLTDAQLYVQGFEDELELLYMASSSSKDKWTRYLDSIKSQLPGVVVSLDSDKFVQVLAALEIYDKRIATLKLKLSKLVPPPGCEKVHILLNDVIEVGLATSEAQKQFISDVNLQVFMDGPSSVNLEITSAQQAKVLEDLSLVSAECL